MPRPQPPASNRTVVIVNRHSSGIAPYKPQPPAAYFKYEYPLAYIERIFGLAKYVASLYCERYQHINL